jgi:hypothetical protein
VGGVISEVVGVADFGTDRDAVGETESRMRPSG